MAASVNLVMNFSRWEAGGQEYATQTVVVRLLDFEFGPDLGALSRKKRLHVVSPRKGLNFCQLTYLVFREHGWTSEHFGLARNK